jgi:phosphoglycolate phosphatase-like HAD superfamily hydrolase
MTSDRERRLRRELHALLERLSADRKPLDLVEDVRVVEDFVDDFAQARIADARAAGASWAEISKRLGVTRQAAHKRFSGWRRRGRAVIELRFTRDTNGG